MKEPTMKPAIMKKVTMKENEVTMKENEVAMKENEVVELAVIEPNAGPMVYEYGDFETHSGESDSKDVLFPYVILLQSISPQLKEEDFNGRAGDYLLQGQDVVYKNKTGGFVFHMAYHKKEYVEWRPRLAGGGMVNRYTMDSAMVAKYGKSMGKVVLDNGNELIETVYLYGVIDDPDNGYPAVVLPFKKTALKKWRQHLSRVQQMFYGMVDTKPGPGSNKQPIPGYAIKWRISSVQETKGNDIFSNIEIKLEGEQKDRSCLASPNHPALQKTKELRTYLVDLHRAGANIVHTGVEDGGLGSIEMAQEIPY
jgi:hypothetical protein